MGQSLHEIRARRRVRYGDVVDRRLAAVAVLYIEGARILVELLQ